MGNIQDYVNRVKDISFDELLFNEVDVVILSLLCFCDFENCIPLLNSKHKITFENAYLKHFELHGNKQFGFLLGLKMNELLLLACKTNRYKNILVHSGYYCFDEKLMTQTSIYSCDINKKTTVIVFGGTDDSIVGWKENFNMILPRVAPCLINSKNYVNKVGRRKKDFILCGHSKGGMEAFYSATNCHRLVQDKIIKVYSLDGPGFSKEIIKKSNVKLMKSKLILLCPSCSVIGRIFENMQKPTIIYSSFHGLRQHDTLSWIIEGAHFKRGEKYSSKSDAFYKRIKEGLNKMDFDARQKFLTCLFKVLDAGGNKTLLEISKHPHLSLRQYLHLLPEERSYLTIFFNHLSSDKIIAKEFLIGLVVK